MSTPQGGTYTVSTLHAVYGGRAASPPPPTGGGGGTGGGGTGGSGTGAFKTMTKQVMDAYYSPKPNATGYVTLLLHGSSGGSYNAGDTWTVTNDLGSAHPDAPWQFNAFTPYNSPEIIIRPVDRQTRGATYIETWWMGWSENTGLPLNLYTIDRLDMMMDWFDANFPNASKTKRIALGGSMGAGGMGWYALRRPQRFAAAFASRPRLRYSNPGQISIVDWTLGFTRGYGAAPTDTSPQVAGLNMTAAQYLDAPAYAANPANGMPWFGWCLGRNDGYAQFDDSVAMVNAMRATNRGFAFAWNNGDHSTGDIIGDIQNTYTYDMFELGRGYPILTGSTLDKDPAVDIAGGINLGFKWRNIVESAGGWSCELSNTLGAVGVFVQPKSDIFKTVVQPKGVTIPAGQWVGVSF